MKVPNEERDEQPLLAVEREVGVLFRRGRARVAELSRRVHPQLEGMAYSLLGHVEQAGPVRVTDVGVHFAVGKATISRQIRALEELGLLAREADPLDRRSALVSLTEEGRRRFLAARDARMGRVRELMADWSEEDVLRFAELLHRFNDVVGEAAVPAG
ncbi:MarR family winged helix-turn-helix transcriptional regulator [Kitasatospora purpeofusca]|uniref:MarR family winged helix-turn-helix transcriptional regulator n=1 Tax=Kitasatospora purpeofusca TaxID=67352 RepID=UPI002A59EAC1|nr:MarR family transcriptional regulator [Kitasatospora purpeofusca]MDY0816452.1 MarR family transcriptional regulator [Kitasatospora purpeofusca]